MLLASRTGIDNAHERRGWSGTGRASFGRLNGRLRRACNRQVGDPPVPVGRAHLRASESEGAGAGRVTPAWVLDQEQLLQFPNTRRQSG